MAVGRFPAWGDWTTIAVLLRSAWTPSKMQHRAPPCCKWHRYGCAWHRRTMPTGTPIRAANKSLPDQSPSQVSPKPGPFPPKSAAAARFLPVAPNGGIPPRSAGIGLTVPCNGNRPADEPFRRHSAPCGWNPMSRGAHAHRCGCNGHSLDDGPVVYRRDDKRVTPARQAQDFANARRDPLRCCVDSLRRRCGQNKKPRRVAGAGP
jgi:hypothetical protein